MPGEVARRTPGPQTGDQRGTLRAYTTVILLALHRIPGHRIGDFGGTASRTLLQKAQFTFPNAPQGMSRALHDLRSKMIVTADIEGSRTYEIKFPVDEDGRSRELDDETVAGLLRDEDWARAFILQRHPLPEVTWAPPAIRFKGQYAELTAVPHGPAGSFVAYPITSGSPAPTNGAGPTTGSSDPIAETITLGGVTFPIGSITAGEAALMRLVLDLEERNRELRTRLGESTGDDVISPQVAGFAQRHDPEE